MSSRLTLHVQGILVDPGAGNFVQRMVDAGVRGATVIDDVDLANDLQDGLPDARIVMRYTGWQETLANRDAALLSDPEGLANNWYLWHFGLLVKGKRLFWQGFNEADFWFWDNASKKWVVDLPLLDAYVRFENKRQDLLATIGARACIWNFAVSKPPYNPEVIERLEKTLAVANQYGNMVGLHCYNSPSLLTAHGDPYADFILRGVQLWERFGWAQKYPKVELAFTEWGYDMIEGNGRAGFKTCGDIHFVMPEYKRLDAEMQQYKYLRFAAHFALGKNWTEYDAYDSRPDFNLINPLLEYVKSTQGMPELPAPTPNTSGRYRTKSNVYLRPEPRSGETVPYFVLLPPGKAVTVEEISGDWAEVKAYIHKSYLTRIGE